MKNKLNKKINFRLKFIKNLMKHIILKYNCHLIQYITLKLINFL